MKHFLIFILLVLCCNFYLFSHSLSGDTQSYTIDDFLGFDDVGDCRGLTGDISSVFANITSQKMKIRVTFDNMVTRKSNIITNDNFFDKDLKIEIVIKHKSKNNYHIHHIISISELDAKTDSYEYLRTPKHNMLELLLGKPFTENRDEFDFRLNIIHNNTIVDTFIADGSGTKATGNCAFVHHGNQGLTYTDVFYGNAFGISGLEGSGYDEVLQVHEATVTPGNFHMSGTLMPAAEWHNPEFNDWLETMAGNGLAAMMTSALGQHMMPFVTDDMNNWSVYTESQMVDFHYNYIPRIAWVPERVWLAQGYYPDAGVIDWLGDNWEQHGIWGVVLDDGPHLNGYDNRKIHWMSNGSGVNLRVIPINNSFVGNMHYDSTAAKNQIASMGQYNICVYGTDWEVAAEMNEHDGTDFLENYEAVLWYCHDNYPAVNVWKLEDAIQNPDFNGSSANITNGTYGLLGGSDGYGGSNNSWYINWASTPSHSDFHTPIWDYGTVWSDAYNFLLTVNDNNLAQLGWYTMMINLHETGWHTSGEIADWEHRYSAHIKNANVYTEASRWADGQYIVTTACYFNDIDHDGIDELVMHNDKVFMVFEEIGGKANWVFYKNGFGEAHSVVSSDMAYWSESDGDYNESSNNHLAALSDVSPNQQNSVYNIVINQASGDTVKATLDQWGVEKKLTLHTGVDYLDVEYNFFNQTGYVKSGWSPGLLDMIWSGKNHLERIWGDFGSYCGYRNSSSGATAALVLGNGGSSHNGEIEGTLVKGDEINGYNKFKVRLFAGYTSPPTGSSVVELDNLAIENLDVFPPELFSPAALVATNEVLLSFNEAVDFSTSENISNYTFQNFSNTYSIINAERQPNWNNVKLTISGSFIEGDEGQIIVSNVLDLNGNTVGAQNIADISIPNGITPHTIIVDGINDFQTGSELIENQLHSLYITWDANNLYLGFYDMDLNNDGDLFVNIDTDQTTGSGATTGSWGRVNFADPYLPEYQVAIEGGGGSLPGGSMQVNNWTGTSWDYPGNGSIGNSYEGWLDNGFTEISIPWVNLGNPAGLAISVHISEEDNQVVPEIFPGLNTTGDHPVINYFYAFVEPYISGPMPLSGMETNTVKTVPNTSPQITSFNPAETNQTVIMNTTVDFDITASDMENDLISYSWTLDGSVVSSSENFSYNPGLTDIGNHTLIAIVSDNVPGNISDSAIWTIEVIEHELILNLKVFLEGPFSGVEMQADLNATNVIPLLQPYNKPPWNYQGIEEVITIPGIDIVDWIIVELRDAITVATAGESTIIGQQAAFIKKDGTIVGIDGSNNLNFPIDLTNNLFVCIWHRNHLGIISANPLVESEGKYAYDFSSDASQVLGGSSAQIQLSASPEIWGMIAGDGDASGDVETPDKNNVWYLQSGTAGYLEGDYNLNKNVSNQDKNDYWIFNKGKSTFIPE